MNKKYILLLIFTIVISVTANAQLEFGCKKFTKSGLDRLDTLNFIHDGRYNAVKLNPGESFDVYKPFYRGKTYNIVMFCDESLPGISFEILTIHQDQVFKSPGGRKFQEFEYTSKKTQNLIIRVSVDQAKTDENYEEACVALLIGYKRK